MAFNVRSIGSLPSHLILRTNGIKSRFVNVGGTFMSTKTPGVAGKVLNGVFGIFGGGMQDLAVRHLQSDCVAVSSKIGDILFGAPPEIVKKLLPEFFMGKKSMPTVLVLANDFLHPNGKIQNEPEFPTYASFFMAKQKLTIIGTTDQIERARVILSESLFGPEDLYSAEQKAESEHFKVPGKEGKLKLDDFVEFITLDTGNNPVDGCKQESVVLKDGVKIVNLGEGLYRVIENGVTLATVDTAKFTPPVIEPEKAAEEALDPPRFGVTFIGTSSGFDPGRRTTSLVLWGNGKGIFIDPLSDPEVELVRYGIDSKDVPYILLTHCHADHDAGVMQRILSGRRVKLVTSKIIYESFLRKAKAMAGRDISHLVDFIEAEPGTTIKINGVELAISRALHSIPTIRFEATYTGEDGKQKKLAYSADTFFVPTPISELLTDGLITEAQHGMLKNNFTTSIPELQAKGVITEERAEQLINFVFESTADLIIHESGMAPIHTPDVVLNSLPRELKDRMILVHTGKVAEGVALKVAEAGKTIVMVPSRKSELNIIHAISQNPIFGSLPVRLISEISERSRLIVFKHGEAIVNEGEAGESVYIVVTGQLNVRAGGKPLARLGKGDYFGEAAPLTGNPRNATVEGLTGGTVLEVKKADFDRMRREVPDLEQKLLNVLESRPTLSEMSFLAGLQATEFVALSSRFTKKSFTKDTVLIEQGQKGEAMFAIKSGQVEVLVVNNKGKPILRKILDAGEIFGETSLIKGTLTNATIRVVSDKAEIFELDRESFFELSENYPRLTFHLNKIAEDRMKEDGLEV